MKRLLAFAAAAVSCAPVISAAPPKNAPAYVQPAENLLIVVADIQRHLNDDIYRFPIATDVTGQNVFRAGAGRLANYEVLYPGKLTDVVSLAKGQAFEKLGDYAIAAKAYEVASKSPDAAVARVGNESLQRTRRFDAAANQPVDKSALRTYERDMQKKIKGLDDLAQELKGTAHRALALVERERAEIELAQFYISMRFMQPYSTDDAIRQIRRNMDRNQESKNRYTHHLMLADLHAQLAREYTVLNDPDGPGFRMKDFEAFINPARTEYHIIEQADGYPEKLEGRAKLIALEAFVERIGDRAR